MKRRALLAAALAGVLALSGCASGDQVLSGTGSPSATDGPIVVGSADFPESQLLATIYSLALQDAGVEVREQFNIGSREVYMAGLQDGSIDLLPEYTGALLKYLDPEATVSSSDDVTAALAGLLPESLTHLEPSPAEDKDTLTVTQATADQYGLASISDLAPYAAEFSLGGPPEWETRATGVPGLQSLYGLTFKNFVSLDAGGPLTMTALLNGQIQVGNVFSTDPAIAANGLVSLNDDRSLFPAQNVVPLVVKAKANDAVTTTLDAVSAALTTEDLLAMNAQLAAGEGYSAVARAWLDAKGL